MRTAATWIAMMLLGAAACSDPVAIAATPAATADGAAAAAAVADSATVDAASPDQAAADTGPITTTCPVAGSAAGVVVFAAGQQAPRAVAIDGDHVYWTATNGLYRRPLTPGPIETLDTGAGSAGPLAVDGEFVFFAHPNTGKLLRIAKGGGTPTELASTSTIAGLAVDAAHVWFSVWLDNGMVARVPRLGGAVVPFASDQAFPVGIALAGEQIAWTTAGGDGKGTSGKVMYGGKQGLGVTPLVDDATGAGAIAMAGGKVFWAEGDKIRTIAIDQSGKQVLVGDQGQVTSVAVAAGTVVFTATGAGGIVGRMSDMGGAVTLLATNQQQPRGLAIGRGCVAWAVPGNPGSAGGGSIRVRDLAATSPGTAGPCTTPNPAGCYGKGKDFCQPTANGQTTTCAPSGPVDGCVPFSCSCDTLTVNWACDTSCGGGVCKPICETTKPTVNCCSGGKFAKPDCDNAVFSCPAGTLHKPFAGCGPFVGDKKPVVTCDVYPCKPGQACCYSIVANCVSDAATPCYGKQACEGSHHCGAGEACCASGVNGPTYISTACKPAEQCTGAPNWRACAGDSDCPVGQSCCAKAPGGKFGLCYAGPCG